MENLYLIQLTFYNGTDEISAYWLPSLFCFTFSLPRALISKPDLDYEMSHAEQHARQVLAGRPFHLYARPVYLKPVPPAKSIFNEGRPA